ncbi:MAG: hypothetical protein AB4372_04920 [Xenococcus sp. (in: cyanobacteria)]
MPNPNFAFDTNTQRYRYTSGRNKGKFVGAGRVRSLLRSYLKSEKEKANELNDQLFNDAISLSDWERSQAKRLKSLALQVYKIGNPELGSSIYDSSDYGTIGGYLKSTYIYLRNFSQDIAQGKLSQAQINQRIGLYYEDLNYLVEESKRKSHKRSNFRWERRRLAIAEHCKDCPNYAALGWQPIGTLPAITTQCECRSNDKCYFEYSKSLSQPSNESILQRQWGWLNESQQIKEIIFNTK